MKENDNLTFRNYKGEEVNLSRREFRDVARNRQDVDHRPNLSDIPIPNLRSGLDHVEKATDVNKLFTISHINGKRVDGME
jgi:hypothetical protein